MLLIVFLVMWVRFTYPRFREDQLQILAWKYLIPISLANIVVTAILKVRVLMPLVPGLIKGLGVTAREGLKTVFPGGLRKPIPAPSKGAATVQYPHVKEDPAPRSRGVIALHEENCTSCMLCARECPDWCIYIEAHKYLAPPRREGGKPRQRNQLDRFDIDYALCMYCGICVEVCPFEALVLVARVRVLRAPHRRSPPRQGPPRRLDDDRARVRAVRGGLAAEGQEGPSMTGVPISAAVLADALVAQNVFFYLIAVVMVDRRAAGRHHQEHRPRRAVPGGRPGRCRRPVRADPGGVHRRHPGARLHRRGDRAVPVRDHADPGPHRPGGSVSTTSRRWIAGLVALVLAGVMGYALIDEFGATDIRDKGAFAGPVDRRRCPTPIFRDFLIPFEVVSLLLLAALIGAIVVARRE